ncbi:Membrane-bound lytic murein transglycosylase B precursor [Dissulfuribacter thermophilus]|uniref:Membrane-bound lytic murein transglycosylase B n=1 Tax=Dissulfuribacter thermophilus TaxID=1156395 RepID=A0A1B9F303_9BACT|nr:lytic murein transglycosylase [Dissulfuribacter thermophilus]OCC14319.1 Membrane-bound lytic murein transglycosylase B precursor [Dissulfuribacter thermophilus]
MSKIAFSICFQILILAFLTNTCALAGDIGLWDGLITRLSQEGFDRARLETLYSRSEVKFEPKTMPKKLLHKEAKLNYSKFLREERIDRATKFIASHRELFDKVEKKYGVPATIKAAILLVETDLGNYTGKYRIFNILSSMAISEDLEKIKPWLPKSVANDKNYMKLFKKKAKKKANWAFRELKALLIYAKKNDIDPVSIKGSPFGAFGLCQFMPSSVLRFGVDFNRDGKVDLFSLEDALASMANYLVKNGWSKDITEKKAFKVILTYNYSRPYANTVLRVAKRIETRLNDTTVHSKN